MIIDKAAQMVRSHPDADKVEFIQGDMPLLLTVGPYVAT
jgi:hypothetical protein